MLLFGLGNVPAADGFLIAHNVFGGECLCVKTHPSYPCSGHVELDGADNHQDEQTAERDLRQ